MDDFDILRLREKQMELADDARRIITAASLKKRCSVNRISTLARLFPFMFHSAHGCGGTVCEQRTES